MNPVDLGLRQTGKVVRRFGSLLLGRKRPTPGAPPGTISPSAEALAPRAKVMCYTRDQCLEREISSVDELSEFAAMKDGVTWIDIHGLGDRIYLEKVGELFGLHSLALEDAVNTPQRPKFDDYETHLFVILRMLRLQTHTHLATEQVSIFLGRNFVVTLQEQYGDVLDPVRERVRRNHSMLRKAGADFLAYSIIDTVIDAAYPALETLSNRFEEIEQALIDNPRPSQLHELHGIKRDLLVLHRYLWPQREAMSALLRDESELLSEELHVYLRDCYDHSVQLMDAVDTYRELGSGLMDLYLSNVSNRMNEVMKVLTIIATIFIPLTFMAGVYGMNFKYMPELDWPWAYPVLWGMMILMAIGMLIYFKRLGWIGETSSDHRREQDSNTQTTTKDG